MAVSQLATFRATVEAQVLAAWQAVYPAGTMTFANVAYDPTGQAVWARTEIKYGMGRLLTMGHANVGANELVGVVLVQIFVPVNTGAGALIQAVDVVRDAMNRVEFADATLFAPSGGEPAIDTESSAWMMTLVSAPFSLIDPL